MPIPLTVTVSQPAWKADGLAANVERHVRAIAEAPARLIVFPEFSLTGYDLAAPPIEANDPRLAPIVDVCGRTGSVALVGAPVREADGRESIGMLAVTGEGVDVVYRKIWLHGDEALRFTPGDGPVVFELDGWRLGLAICADAAEPQHAADTAALGINAYVASTLYESCARRDRHMAERAETHGVWGVLATSAGVSGSFAATTGGSGIWRPDGSLMAQAGAKAGAVLSAKIG